MNRAADELAEALSNLGLGVDMERDGLAAVAAQQDPNLPARHLKAAVEASEQRLGELTWSARQALTRYHQGDTE